jgi:predicted Rossmann-fold nucleotide-binding protein
MGTEYWTPLLAFLRERLLAAGTVSPDDLDLITVTDSVEEAVALVRDVGLRRFGLRERPRPIRALGEA